MRNLCKHNVHWNIHFTLLLCFPLFLVTDLYVHCYYYLLRHTSHRLASLISHTSAFDSKKTDNFFTSELYARVRKKQLCTQHVKVLGLVYQRDIIHRTSYVMEVILPVQKLLLLLISFGASTIFTSLSTVELYATSRSHRHFSHDCIPRC